LSVVEQAAGLRIQMEDQGLDAIKEDPQRFLRRIPELVETSMGLRIWAGVVQAVERRIGESLNLQPNIQGALDWDQASDELQGGLQRVWDTRTEALLSEIEADLDQSVQRIDLSSWQEKLRIVVQMSYGQRSFFDRKTHQRQAVLVSRLSYPYYTAELLRNPDVESLTDQVMEHLDGAQSMLEHVLGRSELQRLSTVPFDQFEERARQHLRDSLSSSLYNKIAAGESLHSLDSEAQESVSRALGNQLLTRTHRELFLSVADREWVEYLTQMEALRTSIGLEAYGQRDPLVQYKSRAFDLFGSLLSTIRAGVVSRMFRLRAAAPAAAGMGVAPAQSAPRPAQASGTTKSKKRKRRRRRR
jgi:preprotein translocase subunit SecA